MSYVHPLDQAINQAAQILDGNGFWKQVLTDAVAATIFHSRIVEGKDLEDFGECREVAGEIINQIFLRKGERKS